MPNTLSTAAEKRFKKEFLQYGMIKQELQLRDGGKGLARKFQKWAADEIARATAFGIRSGYVETIRLLENGGHLNDIQAKLVEMQKLLTQKEEEAL